MASLGMGKKSYDFNRETIDKIVGDNRIGNYALGYCDKEGTFKVLYCGRSDTNLNRRLKEHIHENEKYKKFKFLYADSVKDAYDLECKNYHDFELKKQIHPDKPEGENYNCLYCYLKV